MRITALIFTLTLAAAASAQTTEVPTTQAVASSPEGVAHVQWSVTQERNLLEYRVYRGEQTEGPWVQIATIEGQGRGLHGARQYHFRDAGLEIGRRYHYLIEQETVDGANLRTGPISYVASREATGEATAQP